MLSKIASGWLLGLNLPSFFPPSFLPVTQEGLELQILLPEYSEY